MTDQISEQEIIKRAKRGDERAFTQLVKRYETLAYSFAFKVCRDEDKASETWQDTFINVYRKLHQFNGRSKFTTWLYSIVINSCRMKHRQRKIDVASISIDSFMEAHNHPRSDDSGQTVQTVPSWKETPIDAVMDKELQALLDSAIRELPHKYRIVFVLRDVQGLSASEAGKILKLSVPAIKSRLRRARVFLRDRLDPYMTS